MKMDEKMYVSEKDLKKKHILLEKSSRTIWEIVPLKLNYRRTFLLKLGTKKQDLIGKTERKSFRQSFKLFE